MLRPSRYWDRRGKMRPGDVLAFSGSSLAGRAIQFVSGSRVSHVGIVCHAYIETYQGRAAHVVEVMESTSLNGKIGVARIRASRLIASFRGTAWHLPLAADVRGRLDLHGMIEFLLSAEGRRYDFAQAFGLLLPWRAREDFERLFCSELVVAALEAGGAFTVANASKVWPHEVCGLPIYATNYFTLTGPPIEIAGFNGESK